MDGLDGRGPVRQDDDAVREADGLGNIVRDEQGRLMLAADDLRNVARDGQPRLIIQGGKRLIQQ